VGVVRTGEGVYGLRRALVLAGSETQVMSLWPVRDYATQRLMKDFYAELKHGQGRGEALRNVKLMTMRRRGTEHPFYWAGFIQSGKWTELDDKR
jgi:CHAT domain-containing protein